MTFTERKQKTEYLLEMIRKGRCFSLKQVACKFECSERTVKRMMVILREEGYDIYYCYYFRKFSIKTGGGGQILTHLGFKFADIISNL